MLAILEALAGAWRGVDRIVRSLIGVAWEAAARRNDRRIGWD